MPSGFGPFHSLSDREITELSELIGSGHSVRQAAMMIGAHYGHCLNYAHAHGLISSRLAKAPTPDQCQRFLALLAMQPSSIHHCAHMVGISVSVGYRIATAQGYHRKRSRTQQRIDQTNLRLDYLRLRLGSLSRRDAATAVGVSRRCATDFDKGLTLGGSPRMQFIPDGPNARAYNKAMAAFISRHDVVEQGRTPTPALGTRIDPYAPIDARYLSSDERATIADMHLVGHTPAEIARALGRHRSTICRELKRNHSAEGPYHPHTAQLKAASRRLRPKPGKLLSNRRLYDYVVAGLQAQWSPEEISNRIRLDHPDDQEMRISHETIYDAFYLDSKGRLKDLGLSLPTGRIKRRRQGRTRTGKDTDRFVDAMTLIDQRPDDVEERILPGHWEGDLILGARNQSAVLTVVERVSRFVVLGHLPTNHGSEEVKRVLTNLVNKLDQHIWSSITWDQGSEMAGHKKFTMATNVPIYFCHPGSPWERGTNENTNGRLRRNLPKSSDLSKYSAEDLEVIANIHNHKPRKALRWRTPAEVMADALRNEGSITN